jgi:hypothetical protein
MQSHSRYLRRRFLQNILEAVQYWKYKWSLFVSMPTIIMHTSEGNLGARK